MLLDANIHTLRCWTMLQNVWTLSMKKKQFNCSRHNTAAKLLILALSNNHSLTLFKTNQLCADNSNRTSINYHYRSEN